MFAFFQLLRHKPKVIVVLRSFREWLEQGGPTYEVRERETECAVVVTAGCEYEQWVFPDNAQSWPEVATKIEDTLRRSQPDVVIAPAWELGGHEDHNTIANIVDGALATVVKGLKRPTDVRYLTYRRGHGRSTDGVQVEATDEWAALKQRALDCYVSQAAHPPTAPWFDPSRYGTLSEWVAA